MFRRKFIEKFLKSQSSLQQNFHVSEQASSWQYGFGNQIRRQASSNAKDFMTIQKAPVTYTTFAVTAALGGMMVWYYQKTKYEREQELMKPTNEVIGTALVGAPFELLDQNGNSFKSESMMGEFVLIYFGFTHCPDICPDELEKLAGCVDLVKERTGHCIQPIMVTCDPNRDTVKQMHEYVAEFHPKMIGLTGAADVVREVCKAYRVYFMNTSYFEEDYLVDHSIITYLIDPEGTFVTFFGKNFDSEMMASSVKRYIKRWKKNHPEYVGRKEFLYDNI